MRTYIMLIILIALIGCSNPKNEPSTVTPMENKIGVTTDEDHQSSDSNEEYLVRGIQAFDDAPDCDDSSYVKFFGQQGHNDPNETMLINSIAVTFFAEAYECGIINYLLTCEKVGKIANVNSCKIWKISAACDPNIAYYTNSHRQISRSDVLDPGACDLIAIKNILYAYIFDRSDGMLKEFRWNIDDTNPGCGDLSENIIYGHTFDYGKYQSAEHNQIADICIVSNNYYDTKWHILVLDNQASTPKISVLERVNDRIWDLEIPITNFKLNDVDYKPLKLCAMKWDDDYPYWCIYVAGRNLSVGGSSQDKILCYHWNSASENYSISAVATDNDSSGGSFPYIIDLDVAKSGLQSDRGNDPEYGHNQGHLCVYMYDSTLNTLRMRQVLFGQEISGPGIMYYQFTEDFDVECHKGEIWPISFAMGFRVVDDDPFVAGHLYFTADQNPDLEEENYRCNLRRYRNADVCP